MAHASGDAHEFPIYGAHFRATFPILDKTGAGVPGAAGLDSEFSNGGGTFADCTNEATEIATNSGMYYLDLIGTEMDDKQVAVQIKTTTTDAKTTYLTLYPERLAVLASGTAQAGAASTITLAAGTSKQDNDLAGLYVLITNNGAAGSQYQARKIISNVASTQVATVDSAWGTNPSSASTYDLCARSSVNSLAWAGTLPPAIGAAGIQNANATHWGNSAVTGMPMPTYTQPTGFLAASFPTDPADQSLIIAATDVIVAAVAAVQADTDNIQARIPAALVSGRMDVSVGAMAADVVTAAAIANGAIDAATFAADTGLQPVRSNTAQAGAAGSITLDASASATTDFYKGVRIYLTGGTGVGQSRTCTAYNGSTKVATISPNWATTPDVTSTFALRSNSAVDVSFWRGNLVGSNVSGFPSVDISYISGAIVNTALAQLGVNVIQAAGTAWGAGAITAGVFAADAITAAKVAPDVHAEAADAVWDEAISGHLGAGSTGAALNAAGSAGDPWTTPLPGAYGAGTAGFIIGTNLDALISSRMATYTQPTGFLSATFPSGTIANTTNITAGTITTVGTVGTLTTYTGNTPQTGDAFARLGAPAGASVSVDVAAIQAKTVNLPAAPASTTNITAGIITTVTNLTNAPTAGDFTATMKTSLNAATPAATVSDKTGFKLAADGLDVISTTLGTGVASNFREIIIDVWAWFYLKNELDENTGLLKTYLANSSTVKTTAAATSAGGVQTKGKAS